MPASSISTPAPFLKIRVHKKDIDPTFLGVCVGYEREVWRVSQLADHVIEWLPEFALTPSEWSSINHANAVAQLREAARIVYQSDKFKKRGEFGELLLHVIIRQVFDSLPAISKVVYKSAVNDTVKGFDAVHVVSTPDNLELWLGEAKFYTNINRAIADVIKELEEHLIADYLRNEFMLIKRKIDPLWSHADKLKELFSPNTSLDQIFQKVCIPILLTYNSECLTKHNSCTTTYITDFEEEITAHYQTFIEKLKGKRIPEVQIHLFLFPLNTKEVVVTELNRKLKLCQQL